MVLSRERHHRSKRFWGLTERWNHRLIQNVDGHFE
jgi:hypothetical protein